VGGGAWMSGKYADKSYESNGQSFKIFGHRKRRTNHQHMFPDCFTLLTRLLHGEYARISKKSCSSHEFSESQS